MAAVKSQVKNEAQWTGNLKHRKAYLLWNCILGRGLNTVKQKNPYTEEYNK